MITAEDIAAFLSREPTFAEYELIVRVGHRYEHPWRRILIGAMPLMPVDDNAVISIYGGTSTRPLIEVPAAYCPPILQFFAPLILKPGEEIYVEIKTVVEPHRSYTGMAVALCAYA